MEEEEEERCVGEPHIPEHASFASIEDARVRKEKKRGKGKKKEKNLGGRRRRGRLEINPQAINFISHYGPLTLLTVGDEKEKKKKKGGKKKKKKKFSREKKGKRRGVEAEAK